jgi:hypothetical protein
MIMEMVEDVLKGKKAFINSWVSELVYVKDVVKAVRLAVQLKFHLLKVCNVRMGCIYA